jgi:hypothetical protein
MLGIDSSELINKVLEALKYGISDYYVEKYAKH